MARERYRRGGTAPNQVCICVDEIREGEFGGKVYSRYSRNPWEFHSLIELLGGMESFYNKIAFPQSAVQLRGINWHAPGNLPGKTEEPVLEKEFLTKKKGVCATYLVTVRYRQNATWQGSFLWVEENRAREFKSTLELMMLIDKALKEHLSGRNPLRRNW